MWGWVLSSGRKWGTVAKVMDRSGGAPPTPPLRSEAFTRRGDLAFRGHYDHSLDAKNRLSIPAKFRAAFSSGVVLAKDSEPCVAVWTPERHESIIERALGGRNPLGSEYKKIARFFQANSFEVELDAAGRVTLPAPLLQHGEIGREVVVAGVGDHLEVWGRERWQAEQASLDSQIEEVTDRLGDPS
jgi:MraZ protein